MKSTLRNIAPIFLVCVIGIFVLYYFSNNLTAKMKDDGVNSTLESIKRAAVSCYAIEGYYPSEISYLEAYGVVVNEEEYFVDYEFIAANLMPNITVIPIF